MIRFDRTKRSPTKKTTWLWRAMLAGGGVIIMLVGMLQFQRGYFIFTNSRYHQTSFAASNLGTGTLLILLAFLPSGRWIYRKITTRLDLTADLHQRHMAKAASRHNRSH